MLNINEIKSLKPNALMDRYVESSERLRRCLETYHPVFAAAGNIGFGKSFVTKLLRNFGIVSHHERTNDPMLHLYYSNRKAFAEIFQVYLSGKRSHQFWLATGSRAQGVSSCVDRSSYEEPLAFIPALHTMEDLTDAQVSYLKSFFDLQFNEGLEARKEYLKVHEDKKISEEVKRRRLNELSMHGSPPPDMLILLHGPQEIAWQRVLERQADYELQHPDDKGKGLPKELHNALHNQYDNFEKNLMASGWFKGPVLVLDQAQVDVVQRTGELFLLESIIDAIEKEHLKETLYREP